MGYSTIFQHVYVAHTAQMNHLALHFLIFMFGTYYLLSSSSLYRIQPSVMNYSHSMEYFGLQGNDTSHSNFSPSARFAVME